MALIVYIANLMISQRYANPTEHVPPLQMRPAGPLAVCVGIHQVRTFPPSGNTLYSNIVATKGSLPSQGMISGRTLPSLRRSE